MSKKKISKIFAGLRNHGYKVQSFNDKRPKRSGEKDWVDHTIYNKRYLIFVEDKLEKDTLSEGQKETAVFLSSIMAINKTVHYFIIKTVKEAQQLHDRILKRDL